MRCRSETLSAWRVILLVVVGSVICVDARIWNDTDMFPLEINEQCYSDGSVTLNIPNVPEGHRLVIIALENDSEFSSRFACWRSSNVSDHLDFPSRCQISSNKYKFRIFQYKADDNLNLYEIVVNSTATGTLKFYLYELDCTEEKSPQVSMRKNSASGGVQVSFPNTFTIGNTKFNSTTKFDGHRATKGILGQPVEIEIPIKNRNLFGQESPIKKCNVRIYGLSNYREVSIENISIVDDYCPSSHGKKIDFTSKYNQSEDSGPSTWRISFKAFQFPFFHPFDLYCETCVECNEVKPVCH